MSMLNIVLLSVAEIFGDFGYKNYARGGGLKGFAQGSLGYVGVIYFLIQSLKQGNVMWVNGLWDGMSGIMESVAAFAILGERLPHWYQYLGIALISTGLVLLKNGGPAH
jgi:multidrug transporter EmrE-like cation transporter